MQRCGEHVHRRFVIEVGQPGVEIVDPQRSLDLARGSGGDRQGQAGVGGQQGLAERPNQRQCGGNGVEPEFPGQGIACGMGRLPQSAHRAQCLLGPRQNRQAFRRQPDKAPITVDQPLAQFLLQRRQPGRERGLRDPAFAGGGGEMAVASQRDQIAQVLELHRNSLP